VSRDTLSQIVQKKGTYKKNKQNKRKEIEASKNSSSAVKKNYQIFFVCAPVAGIPWKTAAQSARVKMK